MNEGKLFDIALEDIKAMKTDIRQILVEISALKVKSGIWGVIGGMIPVLITIFFLVVRSL